MQQAVQGENMAALHKAKSSVLDLTAAADRSCFEVQEGVSMAKMKLLSVDFVVLI